MSIIKRKPNLFPSGPETDAIVASLRGGQEGAYSTDEAMAFLLWDELAAEQPYSISLHDRMGGTVKLIECCVYWQQARQDHTTITNGFSDTRAGAICAAYIVRADERLQDSLGGDKPVERAAKRVHAIDGADFEVATSGHAKLAEHEYDEEHAEVAT